jgi:hypothetical protein
MKVKKELYISDKTKELETQAALSAERDKVFYKAKSILDKLDDDVKEALFALLSQNPMEYNTK